MIDTETERLVTITEAAKLLPSRPNVATLWRWRTAGVRGVRLETIMLGGRRMTSREALQRFHEGVTAAADGEPLPSRSNRQRERDERIARTELQEDGLLPV
jgi:hypothetical protein